MPCHLPCRASLAHLSRRVPACAQDTIVYGFAGFLILGGALPLALPLPLALTLTLGTDGAEVGAALPKEEPIFEGPILEVRKS